jgi:hypothetical protein
MTKWVFSLLLVAVCLASDATKTMTGVFTGVVHDNKCVGPACATLCPISKDPVYTLQAGDDAWVLSDAKKSAPYAGKKVTVTGTLVDGYKLKVISIVAAR